MPQDQTLTIRPLRATDRADWARLWTGYLAFYETVLPQGIYDISFARLMSDAAHEYRGLIAERGGVAVGLAHYLFHRDMWCVANTCYLQDLFVDPALRGGGVGRALIAAVRAAAKAEGAPEVYWHTQSFNSTARRLYDKVAELSPFVRYEVKTS
jgi:GNAT superfamily N-acetyltransferase